MKKLIVITLFVLLILISVISLNATGKLDYFKKSDTQEEVKNEVKEDTIKDNDLFTLSCKGNDDEKIEIPYSESADLSNLTDAEKEIYILMFDVVRKQQSIQKLNEAINERAKITCEDKGYLF